MASVITNILAGGALNGVANVINAIRGKNPADADKLAELATNYQVEFLHAQSAVANAASEIIKAEAQSQSWLPRNVRPLLLLLWGLAITFNALVPIIARLWIPALTPVPLDPWVYKLTAIGFTGYVTARTVEKIKDSDN